MDEKMKKIDHSALRVNQFFIIALIIVAFVLDAYWLAGIVALVMVLGTISNTPGFGLIYHYTLKPLRWIKPEVLLDNPEPHRFAQGLGALFMVGSSLALWVGMTVLGWVLAWIVAALAALNLLMGICIGCMVYYWLARLRVPGFYKSPPVGTSPGRKPKRNAHGS